MGRDPQVLVVGGGPVGLLLGCLLARAGVSLLVLEQLPRPAPHSRAIGIHPPALELFDRIGLTAELLGQAVLVRRGHALARGRRLGTLSFASCPPPHRYVLSLPQRQTERALERCLQDLDPTALRRGCTVTAVELAGRAPRVCWREADGAGHSAVVRLVVGCDGKRSSVRRWAGIQQRGAHYPDRFIMGDFDDNTPHGADAALYLEDDGLVECFPLPNGRRRWVVALGPGARAEPPEPRPEMLSALLWRRLGHDLAGVHCHWTSTFGVEWRLAQRFSAPGVALCGDAAHVVSPLGGQGMNLGWLGAAVLAGAVPRALDGDAGALARYEQRVRPMARRAIRRAEVNMALGRSPRHPRLRNALVRGLLLPGSSRRLLAQLFTMRGLERWPV